MSTRISTVLRATAALALCALALAPMSVSAQTPQRARRPRMRAMAGAQTVVSAPRFVLQVVNSRQSWSFSELAGINSQVAPAQYIYTGGKGQVNHTKQYGKTRPPTVTLKKPMDTDRSLWAWHMAVQNGNLQARQDATLMVYSAGQPTRAGSRPAMEYVLQKAWPKKIEVSGMKAGRTDTAMITVTFACDRIQMLPGPAR